MMMMASTRCILRSFSTTTCCRRDSSTIVVALSGGVDSSVAAALLQQTNTTSNFQIQALHMSNWNVHGDDDSLPSCSAETDWNDTQRVAQHLDLPITRHSFESEYWNGVFEPFLQNIQNGIMGNPDLDCNRIIKFGSLPKYCFHKFGKDTLLATGHYARLWKNDSIPQVVQEVLDDDPTLADWLRELKGSNEPILLAAADRTKDQSYFLASCSRRQFHNVVFPLGDYCKNKSSTNLSVRQLAQQWNLPTADKRDSMGICFVGKRKSGFRHFVQDYLPPPQDCLQFVNVETNKVIHTTPSPQHAVLYTIGQGAKLSGASKKYFVVDISSQHGVVWVCAGTHHPALYADTLELDHVHWMVDSSTWPRPLRQPHGQLRAQCRIRHLQPLVDCTLVVAAKNNGSSLTIHFDKPVRGITPGQMAVLYVGKNGLVCLGGGPIARRGATYWEQGRDLPPSLDLLHPSGHNDTSITTNDETTITMTASSGL